MDSFMRVKFHLMTREENACSFHTKTHFVLLNTQEKCWKVATEDFVLFILFAIGKKFSFPTFFQLRHRELVTRQLRVFDGCFHVNYIIFKLIL